jgi:NAD(P) transhydrogenase subunit alpha
MMPREAFVEGTNCMTDTRQERAPVTLGVPKERADGETRVALVPDIVKRLSAEGATVLIESEAGREAAFLDDAYVAAGAEVVASPDDLYGRADVILKVGAPASHDDFDELAALKPGQMVIAFLGPLTRQDLVEQLRRQRVEAFSMDAIPRTTRAQSMDALSSQSNLAGYKSVIMAAEALGKIFPLMMTAAGTITPARVLILGAGVAGLQAIGTARRLGAVVYGYDVRAVVKEQVESLGGRFVELDLGEDLAGSGGYAKQASEDQTRLQQEGLAKEAAQADVVISTALIPGRPAPLLITADAVKAMKPGSVIVDLAGEMGGNCELSQPGQTVVEHDVTIMAPLNVPGLVPVHASQVYAKNIQNFLGLIIHDGQLDVNFDDDIVAGTAIVHDGEIIHGLTRQLMGLPALDAEPEVATGDNETSVDVTAEPDSITVQDEPSDPPDQPEMMPVDETMASKQPGDPDDDVDVVPPSEPEASSPWDRESEWSRDKPDDIDVDPDQRGGTADRDDERYRSDPPPTRRDSESGGSA